MTRITFTVYRDRRRQIIGTERTTHKTARLSLPALASFDPTVTRITAHDADTGRTIAFYERRPISGRQMKRRHPHLYAVLTDPTRITQ